MSVPRRCAGLVLTVATVLSPLAAAAPAEATSAYEYASISEVTHLFPNLPATASVNGSIPVTINWKATPGEAEICEYLVRIYRISDGQQVGEQTPEARAATFNLAASDSYYAAVYPLDCNGTYGNGSATPTFFPRGYTEADVTRSGPNWAYKNVSGALGGRIAVNRLRGSSFSIYSCYTNLVWLAQKGPQGGMATVKVDGVTLRTINLYSASVQNRQLVQKTFDVGNGCHTYQVTNTSTSNTRNQLTLDAIYIQYE